MPGRLRSALRLLALRRAGRAAADDRPRRLALRVLERRLEPRDLASDAEPCCDLAPAIRGLENRPQRLAWVTCTEVVSDTDQQLDVRGAIARILDGTVSRPASSGAGFRSKAGRSQMRRRAPANARRSGTSPTRSFHGDDAGRAANGQRAAVWRVEANLNLARAHDESLPR